MGFRKRKGDHMFNKITNTLCAIITILTVIPMLTEGFNIYWVIGYSVIILLIYGIPLWVKYGTKIKTIFIYYLGLQKYDVELRETIYRFLSRTEMEHIKHFTIVSRINGLNEYSTRVGWSKDGELDIKPYNSTQTIVSKWKNDKMTHLTLLFDRYYKRGEKIETGIILDNLKDPEKESMLYLSTGIFENTKKVCLKIECPAILCPTNIQLSFFREYFDPYPTYTKQLTYNYEDKKIEFEEDFPVKGSKYMITWEFNS